MEFRVDFASVLRDADALVECNLRLVELACVTCQPFFSFWTLNSQSNIHIGVKMEVKLMEILHWWFGAWKSLDTFQSARSSGGLKVITQQRPISLRDRHINWWVLSRAWCHCRWYAKCSAAATATNRFHSRACWGVKLKSEWNELIRSDGADAARPIVERSKINCKQLRGWKSLINQIFILLSGLVNYDKIIDT